MDNSDRIIKEINFIPPNPETTSQFLKPAVLAAFRVCIAIATAVFMLQFSYDKEPYRYLPFWNWVGISLYFLVYRSYLVCGLLFRDFLHLQESKIPNTFASDPNFICMYAMLFLSLFIVVFYIIAWSDILQRWQISTGIGSGTQLGAYSKYFNRNSGAIYIEGLVREISLVCCYGDRCAIHLWDLGRPLYSSMGVAISILRHHFKC